MGAAGFLVVKTIEYSAKWNEHVWVGAWNKYNADNDRSYATPPPAQPATRPTIHAAGADSQRQGNRRSTRNTGVDVSQIKPRYNYPSESGRFRCSRRCRRRTRPDRPKTRNARRDIDQLSASDQWHVSTFFSCYFLMTGLHGIHVLVGMGLITWLLIRATEERVQLGIFHAGRSGRALLASGRSDLDLLFPLLYLIH